MSIDNSILSDHVETVKRKRGRPRKSDVPDNYMGDSRARVWDFILYPESAPENWRDRLRELRVQGAISPCHDMDVDNDGEPKKAHHHITLVFEGPKSYSQVKAITDSLHCPRPMQAISMRGSIRYMSHIDYPDKYPYSPDDIESLCGFDYSIHYQYRDFEITEITIKIEEFIDQELILEYNQLCRLTRYDHRDWYEVIIKHRSLHFQRYVSSLRHQIKENS